MNLPEIQKTVSSRNKTRKVFLFVYLAAAEGYAGASYGIGYLVPIIKKHSYDVFVIAITKDISSEEFRKKVESFNPSIVGFSCTSPQFLYLKKYSDAIKSNEDILQICGGSLPTLDSQTVLTQTAVKGVAIGEGEQSVDRLLDNIENSKSIFDTAGFYWNIDGKIKTNQIPHFIEDLSQLEFPDTSVYEDWMVCNCNNELEMVLSRGCPYECSYCSNKALKDMYPSSRGYFRIPSIEYTIELIEGLVKRYPQAKNLSFNDDLLIANKKWYAGFAEEYTKKIGLPYRINVKPETLTPEIVKVLKESGCYLTMMGLESGNEQLRKKLLNRHYSNKLVYEKSKLIKDADILLSTFNIVGWPYETKEEMLETLEINREIGADTGVCAFFYPFRGTELYRLCKKDDLLKEENTRTDCNSAPNIKLTRVSEEDCIHIHHKLMKFFMGTKETVEFNFSHAYLCKE
jgi:anaerobic magnesium-protoporphyrin IX monomethyl ester cyclase